MAYSRENPVGDRSDDKVAPVSDGFFSLVQQAYWLAGTAMKILVSSMCSALSGALLLDLRTDHLAQPLELFVVGEGDGDLAATLCVLANLGLGSQGQSHLLF